MLEGREITKSYVSGSETLHVLKGANITIHKGEIVAIIGPSGIGKSTLLHMLGALDRPDSGSVIVNGVDVFSLKDDEIAGLRNRAFGFVFQFHHLLPELTAAENVMMPCVIAGMDVSEAEARAEQVLSEEVGLKTGLTHRPRELSGGEQQRVAVARALVMNPSVVLADEPSGNLDPESSELLHQLIWKLRDRHGQSYVVVTHNIELARKADRVLKLFDGVVQDVKI
ncbi:MAG: ABC transporter ATP-binding protein [Candidatus Eisenbacteria bacterium]